MKTKLTLTYLIIPTLLLGCAHSTNKQIDEKISQENQVQRTSDLRAEAAKQLQAAPGLTDSQRENLSSLQSVTSQRLRDLQSEGLKLRSILIKDVLSTNYNAKEVSQLKKRIQKVEGQRLDTLFSAIDNANDILGRSTPESRRAVAELFNQIREH